MKPYQNFIRFLKEYKIIAISVAFVISLAALNLIQSLVNDIILPMLKPLISRDSLRWEEMIVTIGPINLRMGSFLSTLLIFLLTIAILYILIDMVFHWKPKK